MKSLFAVFSLSILVLTLSQDTLAAPRSNTCIRGPLRDQRITVANEERFYFMYTPLNYDCTSRLPLVIDLHGVATGTDRPEEAFVLDGAAEFANRRNVLVVRPRSRFVFKNSQKSFSWDVQGARDVASNIAFINALVADLRSRLPINESQIYIMGFANGSQMAAQFLAVTPQTFAGFGFVGGGLWANPGPMTVNTFKTRIYIANGHKEITNTKKWNLLEYLNRYRFPLTNILDRRTDSGHQLSPWHYLDFWNWMQGREIPTVGLPYNWAVISLPGARAILDLTSAHGLLYASTDNGQVWKRRENGRWELLFQAQRAIPFASLCVFESGVVVAGGANVLIQSDANQKNWRSVTLPDIAQTWINGLRCGKNHFFAATFPHGLIGTDIEAMAPARVLGPTVGVDLLTAALSPDGRLLALGARGAMGFSSDYGRTFRYAFNPSLDRRWLYEVRWQNGFWGAGERGLIAYFDQTGAMRTLETGARDLYSVYMSERGLGAAAGLFGAFVVSRDGGRTWRNLSIDVGFSFSAVHIDRDNTIVLGDEFGRIYHVKPSLWP